MVLKPRTPAHSHPAAGRAMGDPSSRGVFNGVLAGTGDTAGPGPPTPVPQMVSITGVRAAGEVPSPTRADSRRVHLELGGKATVDRVRTTADRPSPTRHRDRGYFNAGQECTAATTVWPARGSRELGRKTGRKARQRAVGRPRDVHDADCGR